MAHELGHGVHAALARPRGDVRVRHPADRRRDRLDLRRDDRPRAAARAGARRPRAPVAARPSLDGAVGAVFRQVAMNRFEDRVHTQRRESGELSVDDFAAAWLETQADLLGDSVELSRGLRSWWSYVPHFIDTPGYVYAYSYGHLLALSVYRRYEQEGEGFVASYLDLLRAGGSTLARGARRDRRRRPRRPGLLERRPRPDRAPARARRADRGRGLELIAAAAVALAVAARRRGPRGSTRKR